jgi:hypothetical protein
MTGRYCVRFDDGKLARMTIPEDAAALLPFWLADPPNFRALVSRQFRIDLEKMRKDEMLTPARECLAAEEMKLNAVERLAAEFAGLDQTGPTQHWRVRDGRGEKVSSSDTRRISWNPSGEAEISNIFG